MKDTGIEKKFAKMDPGFVKKVCAVQGSPRKAGVSKTEIVLQAFLEGCRNEGAETETVYLREKNVNHCVGCYTCWTRTPGKCIHKDDVPEIMKKQEEADLNVLAFPLYHFGIISLLKKYIERTLPSIEPFLIERYDGKTTHPIREGYKGRSYTVILSVCGFPEVSHFGALSENFHYLSNAAGDEGFNIVGEIYRPCSEVLNNPFMKDETDRVLSAVREAGAQVVREGTISKDLIDAIGRVDLDIKNMREMANKAWEHCIETGKTMAQLQQELINGMKQ